MKQNIKELKDRAKGRTCLIVSGGPSLVRRKSLERLKPVLDDLIIVSSDGYLGHCLRNDIVPDYVLSVDPGEIRIVRWFGDENLTKEKLADNYFRRQDLDVHFNDREIERNAEQIRLVNAAGAKIKAVLATSVASPVRERCFSAGMDVYWWNPIYDDPTEEGSDTAKLHRENKAPCMNAGGNVGSASTIFAIRILNASRVILTGMDFSYYSDTPLKNTQYYDQLEAFMTEKEIPYAFKTIYIPFLEAEFYTDPAYSWYCDSFLELASSFGGCEIINATEGGILFGDGITWQSIEEVKTMLNKENKSK